MHRSRRGGLIIDCRTEDLEAAVEFWSQALGCRMVRSIDPADANYVQLETAPNELDLDQYSARTRAGKPRSLGLALFEASDNEVNLVFDGIVRGQTLSACGRLGERLYAEGAVRP